MKFFTSHFRNKHTLEENSLLQVGYKSDPVYHNCEEIETLLLVEMFAGNKSEKGFKDFTVRFEENKHILLYGEAVS